MRNDLDGEVKEHDTDGWKQWCEIPREEEVDLVANEIFIVEPEAKTKRTEMLMMAKKIEFDKWIKEGVIEEVENTGQDCLSTTWVVTVKMREGEEMVKARLVARGFEENEKVRSDSPTCLKDNIRILLGEENS